jgi:hypothetical protein
LKSLKENIAKQKQNISEVGQAKATKEMNDQINAIKGYTNTIPGINKNTVTSIELDLTKRIKECDDEYNKTKQDLI